MMVTAVAFMGDRNIVTNYNLVDPSTAIKRKALGINSECDIMDISTIKKIVDKSDRVIVDGIGEFLPGKQQFIFNYLIDNNIQFDKLLITSTINIGLDKYITNSFARHFITLAEISDLKIEFDKGYKILLDGYINTFGNSWGKNALKRVDDYSQELQEFTIYLEKKYNTSSYRVYRVENNANKTEDNKWLNLLNYSLTPVCRISNAGYFESELGDSPYNSPPYSEKMEYISIESVKDANNKHGKFNWAFETVFFSEDKNGKLLRTPMELRRNTEIRNIRKSLEFIVQLNNLGTHIYSLTDAEAKIALPKELYTKEMIDKMHCIVRDCADSHVINNITDKVKAGSKWM